MDLTTRFEELPDILTVDEAASLLRLGRSSVYDAIRRQQIQAVRIGRRILVPKAGLLPFVTAGGACQEEIDDPRQHRETR